MKVTEKKMSGKAKKMTLKIEMVCGWIIVVWMEQKTELKNQIGFGKV